MPMYLATLENRRLLAEALRRVGLKLGGKAAATLFNFNFGPNPELFCQQSWHRSMASRRASALSMKVTDVLKN